MAVDTRNKRMSMIGLALASPSVMANPDGAIGVADRAQLLWFYSIPLYFGMVKLRDSFKHIQRRRTIL